MNRKHIRMIFTMAFLAVTTAAMGKDLTTRKAGRPLKIYLLAGQSNMQGKAQDFTIARMAMSPESKELHDKLVDETGKPKVHENVSAVYFTKGSHDPEFRVAKGKLSTGFGENMGTELAFGVTMDEALNPSIGLRAGEPILIIKVAFGGKSLARDFRSPSICAEPGNAAAAYYLKKMSGEEKKAALAEMRKTGAPYYKLMMERFKEVLADPGKYCEAYDPKVGYEIAGFGWFQGFNDLKAPEGYAENMGHFIRDVRKELDAPNMPFVIGIIGVGGNKDPHENMVALRKEQAATAEIPEFKGNVAAVPTACFWDDEMAAALERAAKAEAMIDESEHWVPIGKPAPSERIWHYTTFSTPDTHRKMEGVTGESSLIEPPGAIKSWLSRDFDTSSWKKGPAPVGKYEGTPKRKGDVEEIEKSFRSPWGEGNMLLMKTTFTCERDEISLLRLWINSTASHVVYLNGTLIRNYPWWKSFKSRSRRDETLIDGKLLKQGVNELAVYGNFRKTGALSIGTLDAYLEGLPKVAADRIKKEQDAFYTLRDRELIKGKSNQEYHYLGSAYTYSRIGEAMAKALLEMQTQ